MSNPYELGPDRVKHLVVLLRDFADPNPVHGEQAWALLQATHRTFNDVVAALATKGIVEGDLPEAELGPHEVPAISFKVPTAARRVTVQYVRNAFEVLVDERHDESGDGEGGDGEADEEGEGRAVRRGTIPLRADATGRFVDDATPNGTPEGAAWVVIRTVLGLLREP